jgi:hypothetical protein
MKTAKQIIQQDPIFLNDWRDGGAFQVVADFEGVYMDEAEYKSEAAPYANVEYWKEKKAQMHTVLAKYEDIRVLFASYSYENYSGDAWVLFEKDGNLYEVNGSHCSCYGLEGQWDYEPVVLEELENRIKNGTFGSDDYCGNVFRDDLIKFLGIDN